MKIKLSKSQIKFNAHTIVWNAYEFLNSQEAQSRIIQLLPNTKLTLSDSSLPADITQAILDKIKQHRTITDRSTKLYLQKTLPTIIISLVVLNAIAMGASIIKKATFRKQYLAETHSRRLKVNQRLKEQRFTLKQNQKHVTLLKKIIKAKVPLHTLTYTQETTEIKASPQHLSTWKKKLTKNFLNVSIAQNKSEIVATIKHD